MLPMSILTALSLAFLGWTEGTWIDQGCIAIMDLEVY